LNDWIIDNELTPYIVVDAGVQGVRVPEDYVTNGQIILNVSPGAVNDFVVDSDAIEFRARFGGVPMQVYIPVVAVMAIYAKENGQGMVFGAEPGAPEPPTPNRAKDAEGASEAGSHHKPSLKIVK